MPDNQFLQQPKFTDGEKHKFPVAVLVMLILQILFLLVAAYSSAYFESSNNTSIHFVPMLLISIIGFPASGIIGIAVFFIIRKKETSKPWLFTLLISSLFMLSTLPPIDLSKKIEVVFRPLTDTLDAKRMIKLDKQYTNIKEEHYNELVEKFREKQHVADVKSNYLLLGNGEVAKVYDFSYISAASATNFEAYAKKEFVGKRVDMMVPEYQIFENNYIPNFHANYFRVSKTEFGDIPVYIHLNGIRLDFKYLESLGVFD